MLRSDRAKGLKVLEDELVSGKNRLTLFAVGDALRDYDGTRAIKTWLSSEKATLREGACIAACAQPFDRDLENSLVRLCFDQDAEVREAAVSAVEYSRRAKEVEVALERAKKVKRSGQRWALIDSILEIGYAGVEPFGHSSNWFDELVGGMPYFEYQYCRKRLLEKRKLLKKNLENSSENFRLDQD